MLENVTAKIMKMELCSEIQRKTLFDDPLIWRQSFPAQQPVKQLSFTPSQLPESHTLWRRTVPVETSRAALVTTGWHVNNLAGSGEDVQTITISEVKLQNSSWTSLNRAPTPSLWPTFTTMKPEGLLSGRRCVGSANVTAWADPVQHRPVGDKFRSSERSGIIWRRCTTAPWSKLKRYVLNYFLSS